MQAEKRMAALFSGNNEAEDWLENLEFDRAFGAGWHLFAKEQLVAVDEAKAQGVWRLDLAPRAIEKSSISHSELIRLYLRCADRAWEVGSSDPASVATRVCDSIEGFSERGEAHLIPDNIRIAWHLKRIDLLLKQWGDVQDPSTGAEIAAAFNLIAQFAWPDDQSDQGEKAAFNAVYWWNQTLALAEQHLQQSFERSDWPEAMRVLELLMQMNGH